MTVSQGTLTVQHRNALGTATGGTTVAAGATLELDAGIFGFTIDNEPLTLNGATLRNVRANHSWSGPIVLGSTSSIRVDSGTALTLGGRISGSGGAGVTKTGSGDLTLTGNIANIYGGPTSVEDGRLFLNKATSILAISTNLTVGNGTGSNVLVRLESFGQIHSNTDVRVNSEGQFDLNGRAATINGLTLQRGTVTTGTLGSLAVNSLSTLSASSATTVSGKLILNNPSTVVNVVNGPASDDLVISARISGAGLVKQGAGTMVLTGNNDYTDTTQLNAGTLRIEGDQASSPVIVNGGTLEGNGTIGELTVNAGTVSPGTPSDHTAILHVHGDLILTPSATYRVDLHGAVAGTGHDQLDVRGDTVALNSATLVTVVGSSSEVGDDMRIIEKTSPNFVISQFNGLDKGAFFTSSNGVRLSIDYHSGLLNHVVLRHENTGALFPNRAITPVVDEGDLAFLTGTIGDPDARDSFFLDVNWGDGTPVQSFTFPPDSPRQMRIPHRYRDDNPTGTPQEDFTFQLSWRDQHGAGNSGILTTIVRNAAPRVFTGLPAFLRPGQTLNRIGYFVDPGRDTWTATVDFGDGSGPQPLDLNDHFLHMHHSYAQEGSFTVTVTVRDDDGGVGLATFQVRVASQPNSALIDALFSLLAKLDDWP